MPKTQKDCKRQFGLQAQTEGSGMGDAQVSTSEARGATAASSSAVIPETVEEVLAAVGIPRVSESLKKIYCTFIVLKTTQSGQPKEGSSVQAVENPGNSKTRPGVEWLFIIVKKTAADFVEFLCDKYTKKETVRKKEMLKHVTKELKSYFPQIFRTVCECMEGVFGIEVKEIDSTPHSYKFMNILDLTYDGMESNDIGLPKTGLLKLVLCVIFMERNRVPEKRLLEVLSVIGVCPGKENFIFGDPRKLITDDFVQEEYLVYKVVPYTYPAYYEFRWGPRTHAETSKMKCLEFFSKIRGSTCRTFATLYNEAFAEDEERIKLVMGTLHES
ncbi:putative MAGE domain-containing protein MAGEA13P [Thomomys bottae]